MVRKQQCPSTGCVDHEPWDEVYLYLVLELSAGRLGGLEVLAGKRVEECKASGPHLATSCHVFHDRR